MKKIYFRADAGAAIGYGHFVRTLALADMLKADFACTFFTCHPTAYQIGEMEKVCPYVALQEETHFDDFLSRLRGDEIVVLDNYFFTTDYQRAIKEKGCRLVCVDDMHDKHYVADVVINHGQTDENLFSTEAYTHLCLGYDWSLLRSPFLQIPYTRLKDENIEKAIVCFGGSDKHNLTEKFVSFLQKESAVAQIIAIVGDKYQSDDSSYSYSKTTYLHNLSASEMADVFSQSDIAFLSASTVCLEALSRQLPVAAGYYVDNQREMYAEYVAHNLIYPLGNLLELDVEKLEFSLIKKRIQALDTMMNPSLVPLRYKNLFQNLFVPIKIEKNGLKLIDYRLLDREQHLSIWKARNEESIRLQMAHAEPILWESHLNFVNNLSSQYRKVYMAVYRDGKLVGSVNIEYESVVQVERGIFILPEFWGKGEAVQIEEALSEYLRERHVASILAKVLKTNGRSLHFHLKLGYKQISKDDKYDYLIKDLNK